jgi:putative SOS response-associated peptidase YedK
MCGRFTLHSRLILLLQQFALEAGPELAPRYNIAPTQLVPVIHRQEGHRGRSMTLMRWGLIPSWAKDASIGNRLINARADSVATKPSFRSAFKRRRCLVPADGYYEWQRQEGAKQPFYIRLQDESPFAIAGLWETWHAGRPDQIDSFTLITTDANEATAAIHDRMPAILDPANYDRWLDPDFDEAAPLVEMLRPLDFAEVKAEPISTYVNNPRNEGPQCIAPQ